MANEIDAQQNSSSALESAIASSQEVTEELQQTQDTQTLPAEKSESQEQTQQQETEQAPFHEHPRFKELVEEKNWYKRKVDELIQRQQQPPAQPYFQQPLPPDPYANMTPEEKVFWQKVDERATLKAKEMVSQIQPVIDAGRMELAQMKVSQFRQEHPDIKPNSPEEMAIAEKIQMGYIPDDAYFSVMGPRGIRVAEDKAKQQVKQKIEAKKQANVENRSLSANAGLPPAKENLTLRQRLEKNYNLIEEGKI